MNGSILNMRCLISLSPTIYFMLMLLGGNRTILLKKMAEYHYYRNEMKWTNMKCLQIFTYQEFFNRCKYLWHFHLLSIFGKPFWVQPSSCKYNYSKVRILRCRIFVLLRAGRLNVKMRIHICSITSHSMFHYTTLHIVVNTCGGGLCHLYTPHTLICIHL